MKPKGAKGPPILMILILIMILLLWLRLLRRIKSMSKIMSMSDSARCESRQGISRRKSNGGPVVPEGTLNFLLLLRPSVKTLGYFQKKE